jgi:hypothetical protein
METSLRQIINSGKTVEEGHYKQSCVFRFQLLAMVKAVFSYGFDRG